MSCTGKFITVYQFKSCYLPCRLGPTAVPSATTIDGSRFGPVTRRHEADQYGYVNKRAFFVVKQCFLRTKQLSCHAERLVPIWEKHKREEVLRLTARSNQRKIFRVQPVFAQSPIDTVSHIQIETLMRISILAHPAEFHVVNAIRRSLFLWIEQSTRFRVLLDEWLEKEAIQQFLLRISEHVNTADDWLKHTRNSIAFGKAPQRGGRYERGF